MRREQDKDIQWAVKLGHHVFDCVGCMAYRRARVGRGVRGNGAESHIHTLQLCDQTSVVLCVTSSTVGMNQCPYKQKKEYGRWKKKFYMVIGREAYTLN